MTNRRRSQRFAVWSGHVARLAVVAALVWIVHAEHQVFLAGHQGSSLETVPMPTIQRSLPAATRLGGESAAVAGGREVVDAAGAVVGTILRTAPAGDDAIGFSGPTDLLVICDRSLTVVSVEILTSRDTRDHVAAIERERSFLDSFAGRRLADVAADARRGDAVAGSTLTCLAIREALALRVGGSTATRRFAEPPTVEDLRMVFNAVERLETDAGDPAVIRVYAADGLPLGWALRTSPVADRVIGYQGPTDAVVCFDAQGRVAGVVVTASFDNEPYVGYVRDDRAFRRLWRGLTIEQIAGREPTATGAEGVSGATMTSQAVAEGIVRAARSRGERTAAIDRWPRVGGIEPPQWGAVGVIAVGIVTAFTRLKGTWFGRIVLPIGVLGYLGFGAGALVSQAQLWGWAQAGVPRGAVVLAALAAAALVLPAITRRNVYCSQLCPHGAAQQLLVRIARPRRSPPEWSRPILAVLPWALLATAILTATLHLPVALVDLEPFDAYLPTVAGIAALAIFATSLLASAFVPMAYCRHACPTGALLDHLRLTGRSHRLTWRDAVLGGCLLVAAAVHWWPR